CDLLSALSSEDAPTIAASNGRSHPVNGLWNTTQIKDLDAYLESGRRSAQGWAESCKAREVSFHADARGFDPFYNINTPADLERIAAEPAVDR
ncbi:MAG: molybdenum cofactor guanylyltransferase MobA, partial [Pseudomonadota bacterium]